jgi:hypothetical protein
MGATASQRRERAPVAGLKRSRAKKNPPFRNEGWAPFLLRFDGAIIHAAVAASG